MKIAKDYGNTSFTEEVTGKFLKNREVKNKENFLQIILLLLAMLQKLDAIFNVYYPDNLH